MAISNDKERSLKIADRICGWILLLGALGHSMGSLQVYGHSPELLLWAECATLMLLLLGALNLLRVGRPGDRALAWVSFGGCIGWLIAVMAFGKLIGNYLDFRFLIQGIVTLALAGFSLRTALGKALNAVPLQNG
jgi:hypothetical protein